MKIETKIFVLDALQFLLLAALIGVGAAVGYAKGYTMGGRDAAARLPVCAPPGIPGVWEVQPEDVGVAKRIRF